MKGVVVLITGFRLNSRLLVIFILYIGISMG
jgi:hypothetical protein